MGFALLVFLAKITVLLVAALGVARALRRAPAGARHLVWLGALGGLLVVPALGAWGPLRLAVLPTYPLPAMASPILAPRSAPTWSGPASAVEHASATSASGTRPTTAAAGEGAASVTPTTFTMPPASTAPAPPRGGRPAPFALGAALLALWAGVALAVGLVLARAWLVVRGIVRRARPLDAPDWCDPLYEVADRLGLADAPRLVQSSEIAMPFACGLRHPTVVLPAASEGWTPGRRRAVLLHELAHVRRRDLASHTLGRVVCAVYWFHPLVWTAARRLRAESERACDDLALAAGAPAADYAEHLLDIVASVRGDRTPAVALPMARRREFEGRLLDILDAERPRGAPTRRQRASLVGALAVLTVVVAAAAPAPAARAVQRVGQVAPPVPVPGGRARDARVAPQPASGLTPDDPPRAPEPVAPADFRAAQAASAVPAPVASAGTSRSAGLPPAGATTGGAETSPPPPELPHPVATAPAPVSAPFQPGRSFAFRPRASDPAPHDDTRAELLARLVRADTSASIRRLAAWGLAEYASAPATAAALAAAVRGDRDADVREMAAWALGGTGRYGGGARQEGAAHDALTSVLRTDADARVRETAAWALGSGGDRATADALAAALADASPPVRAAAAWALGNVGLRAAPHALVAALGDRDAQVRKLAAWALFSIEDPAAAPALQAALRAEGDPKLRVAYVRALAAFGERSVDALRSLLDSPDPQLKAAAVRALAGGDAGIWPWPWPRPRPFP